MYAMSRKSVPSQRGDFFIIIDIKKKEVLNFRNFKLRDQEYH